MIFINIKFRSEKCPVLNNLSKFEVTKVYRTIINHNYFVMKKIVQDTDYVEISHDPELKLGKIEWKRKTSTEEYQYAFISLLGYAKNNPTENFLSDIRRQTVVSPENRIWFEKEMLPKAIKAGLKRAGVVFDGNVFKKYYINMIIKVTNKFGLPMKIFNSEEDALNWFSSFDK